MMTPSPADATGPEANLNHAFLWTIALVAAMGGLLFGYDWVVIGGAKPFFEPFFGITRDALDGAEAQLVVDETMSGWVNSCALLGCLIGSLCTGALSDRFGRRRLLVVAALLFAVSSVLTGWAGSLNQFIAWRILGGVAIGMASNLSPLYIAEVAPAHLRGRLVAMNQLTIVIGILAAQIINWAIAEPVPDEASAGLIRESWNGQYGWRWMFTAVTAPSLLFFVGALLMPESPRWLVKSGRTEAARQVLARIAGDAQAAAALRDIQSTLAANQIQRVRLTDLLERRVLKVLTVGVLLAVLQQWSGINSIFNYAEEIYRSAGFGVSEILFNIVITGAINLLFTLVAIGTVDRIGRRALMLFGCAGIGLSHVLIGLAYTFGLQGTAVLVFTLCALGCYAMSLAPVTWVLIAELFPNRIRGTAISVAVSALWIACFLLTFMFPILKTTIGVANIFGLYALICFAGLAFVYSRVPETRGKSLEQIERELVD